MQHAHTPWTNRDLERENAHLRAEIAALARLVLEAEDRALRGHISPFEGRSLILHERTWDRLRYTAERCLARFRSSTRGGKVSGAESVEDRSMRAASSIDPSHVH